MNPPQARIVEWAGASPEIEHVDSEGTSWYTRLAYRDHAGLRVEVCLLPKRGPRDRAGGGTRATSSADSQRLAVTLAVDILYEAQPDAEAFRPFAAALLSGDGAQAEWQPAVLMVDGLPTPATMRAVGEGAWAASAELPDHYLAVSGTTARPMSALAFAVDPMPG